MKTLSLKQTLSLFILGVIAITASAQKLPTEQVGSLRAPANVKIDGNAAELNNQFQAYNKHTDFYYTLSNDDNNLYLTVQAIDPAIVRKIINGGITLTINRSGQKKDKESMSITYPVFEKNVRFMPNFNTTDKPVYSQSADIASMSVTRPDSLINATNSSYNEKAKLIKVTGIKNVDTLISVYNTDGIKAAAAFNNKMAFTYELSVSLKKLGLTVDNPQKFAYQVKINEVISQGVSIISNTDGVKGINFTGPMGAIIVGQAATDFWGEYTLAK